MDYPGNIFVVLPGTENPWTPSETVANNRRVVTRGGVLPSSLPDPAGIDARSRLEERTDRVEVAMGPARGRSTADLAGLRGPAEEAARAIKDSGKLTARLMIQSPWEQATALVTTERAPTTEPRPMLTMIWPGRTPVETLGAPRLWQIGLIVRR